MSEKKRDEDTFESFKNVCISCEDQFAKLVPQYLQSLADLTNAYIDTCKKVADSSATIAREIANATGTSDRFYSANMKNVSEVFDAYTKAVTISNKAVIAMLDSAKENIELFNNNVDTFTRLNLNMIKTWQSFYTPPKL